MFNRSLSSREELGLCLRGEVIIMRQTDGQAGRRAAGVYIGTRPGRAGGWSQAEGSQIILISNPGLSANFLCVTLRDGMGAEQGDRDGEREGGREREKGGG